MRSIPELEEEIAIITTSIEMYKDKLKSNPAMSQFYLKEIAKKYNKLSLLEESLESRRRHARHESNVLEQIQSLIQSMEAYFYINKHIVIYTDENTDELEVCSLYVFTLKVVEAGLLTHPNKDKVLRAFNSIGHIKN